MINVVTKFKIVPGRMRQALEWAAKIASYVKKTTPDWDVFTLTPISGVGEVEFVFSYNVPSLSKYDEAVNIRRDKSDWQALVKEARESDWFLGITRQFYNIVE